MSFEGADGYKVVCETHAQAWRPRRPLSVSDWAQRKRRLSRKSSREAGQWTNDRIPFLVAVMDSLDVRKCIAPIVVFMKSSQVGATECGLNWVGWTIEESPTSFQSFFPGEKLGRKWGRLRLEPMIAECPSLRALIPLGRRADKGDTVLEKHFPDGQITVGSANIPTDMASTSAERILLDEVDRFPLEVGDEGDPVELILRRGTTYKGVFKAFLNSSPTISSLSHIAGWWKQSSQAHYFVPCPHCTEMQVLVWEQVEYPEHEPKQAKYKCAHCKALIAEHHKTDMLARGEWRHSFPDRVDDVIGFHINCLYTPIGLGDTWGDNAVAYERAKRDPAKLKVFTNTRLGETHDDPRERLDWEALYERREPWALRSIPKGALVLTSGVDIQRDRIEVQTIGWGRDEIAWVVDYVVQQGDPTRGEVWDWLDDYLIQPFVNSSGVDMRIASCGIDAGYKQHEVLNFVRSRKARNIFATKGMPQFGRQLISRPSTVDLKWNGQVFKRGAEFYPLGQATAKTTLFERLLADGEVPITMRHVHFPGGLRDDHLDALPQEYYRQLSSEVFDPHKRLWVQTYERNETLDTFIIAMAAAMHPSIQVHRNGEADWIRLEALYEPTEKVARKPEPIGDKPIVTTRGAFIPMRATVKPSDED